MECGNCGTKHAETARFCGSCGHELVSAAPLEDDETVVGDPWKEDEPEDRSAPPSTAAAVSSWQTTSGGDVDQLALQIFEAVEASTVGGLSRAAMARRFPHADRKQMDAAINAVVSGKVGDPDVRVAWDLAGSGSREKLRSWRRSSTTQGASSPASGRQTTFGEAVRDVLRRAGQLRGRTSRAGYWWHMLAVMLLYVVLGLLIDGFQATPEGPGLVVAGVFYIAMLFVSGTAAVRRLHDTGRSGWWVLLGAVPCLGALVLLVWYLQPSVGPNRWGPPGAVQEQR